MLSLFLLLFSAVLLVVAYAMLSKEERKLTAAAEKAKTEAEMAKEMEALVRGSAKKAVAIILEELKQR